MLEKKRVKFPHRMLYRLLTSHVLLVTIPLLLTVQILTNTAQRAIEEMIRARNLEIVKRSAQQIAQTLEKAYDILQLSAESPAIYQMGHRSQGFTINKIVYEFDIFQILSVYDREGRLVVSTEFAPTDGHNHHTVSREVLDRVIAGQAYSSDVYLSPENLPKMDVYVPIRSQNETVGLLKAEVDLKAIWALVDSIIVGKKGEAFIIREDGQFIAHTDRRKVLQGEIFQEPTILQDMAAGGVNQKIYQNRNGVEMIVAYAPIYVRGKEWRAVIQQPTREAFAPSRTMRLQIFVIMFFSICMAALIAFFYTRKILRPVDRLVSGINRIASGDLRYRIEPLGKDEISQLAEHFNAMAARLKSFQNKLKRTERLETLGKLASVLSHEIRNPLNSMVINMQILRREYQKALGDTDKLDHYHNIVVSEIKRVDELVGNFLMIARPPKLEPETRKIADILDEVITMQQPIALPRGIRIERKYVDPDLRARVDHNKMKQVFLNIVINAIQAMPGGGRLLISLERQFSSDAEPPQEMIKIGFHDTGKGIKKEDLKHIFDFYFSTKKDGTGIGLSIAQQIVEEHGGFIRVESEYKKGTTVFIYLPIISHS